MCPKATSITFLFAPGCSNSGPALRLLRRVLAEEGCRARLAVRPILNEDDAIRNGFLGSPTILIDGVDVEGPPIHREPPHLRCRIFRPHGACPGVPDASLIRRALYTHPGKRGTTAVRRVAATQGSAS